MKIIHVTDPHLVRRGELLHGLDPFERLREAVCDIRDHHVDARLCVITGDLTHHGRPEEYEAFREAIADLPMPVQLLIGNHDDRACFRAAFPNAPLDAAGFVQHEVVIEDDALLFLDTNEPGTHAGRYCEIRRAWLAERLREHAVRRRRIVLFMHHAPARLGMKPMDDIMLADHEDLAGTIRAAGGVAYIVFGHVHRPVSGLWAGTPFTAIRGTNHQVWLDFSVTEGIPCSHEPPMYGIILLDHGQIAYHAHEHADPSRKYIYVPEAH
jgi:3',5'-cyclic-AMP phosphodiesterase